jgi:hypothetical protein
MLASHSQLTSFTESHFFANGFRHFKTENLIYIPKKATYKRVMCFYEDNGFEQALQDELKVKKSKLYTAQQWTEYFIHALDCYARNRKKNGWIEKTPRHLRHIKYISKQIPDALFIHILRDGRNVAASIFEVSNQNVEVWGEETIESSVDQWNQDLKTSMKWLEDSNGKHLGVRYEELVEAPEQVLRQICTFLQLDWDPAMLEYQSAASGLIHRFEVWKGNNVKQLQRNSRYDNLTGEQKQVMENTLDWELESRFPTLI